MNRGMAEEWESGRRPDEGRTMWCEEQTWVSLPVPRDVKRPLPASWRKEHGTKNCGGDREHPPGGNKGRAVHEGGASGARAVS